MGSIGLNPTTAQNGRPNPPRRASLPYPRQHNTSYRAHDKGVKPTPGRPAPVSPKHPAPLPLCHRSGTLNHTSARGRTESRTSTTATHGGGAGQAGPAGRGERVPYRSPEARPAARRASRRRTRSDPRPGFPREDNQLLARFRLTTADVSARAAESLLRGAGGLTQECRCRSSRPTT